MADSDFAVSSPRRKKKKKHTTATAHIMMTSRWFARCSHTFIRLKMAGVIGKWGLLTLSDLLILRDSFGMGVGVGSGMLC